MSHHLIYLVFATASLDGLAFVENIGPPLAVSSAKVCRTVGERLAPQFSLERGEHVVYLCRTRPHGGRTQIGNF